MRALIPGSGYPNLRSGLYSVDPRTGMANDPMMVGGGWRGQKSYGSCPGKNCKTSWNKSSPYGGKKKGGCGCAQKPKVDDDDDDDDDDSDDDSK